MKFEDSLKKLEELVRMMEKGDMPIDDMIKSFEEGRELVAQCQKELESVRLKIEKVVSGGVEQVPVKPDGDIEI